ncbi:hypothetical protein BKA70DRAFT_1561678 [Coprinopsis sp. MPI-PUGE-AT-0042]|nr:hypothetical protein BKA70DRAFT_1561678 [Coprinopsis sp. MPI-PUGE-AT-0042]
MAIMDSPVEESMPPSRRSTGDTLKSDSMASPADSSICIQSIGSTSNSSSSPVGPVTPPNRNDRVRSRYYGDLGRVPLHRRGTSKTYERLEDLLKEAGYKETRVFTPEAERVQAAADDDHDQKPDDNKTTGMGQGKQSRGQSTERSEAEYSPPRSPLVDRGQTIQSPVTPGELTSPMDSCDDDDTPRPTRQVSEARSRPPPAYRGPTISSRNSQTSLPKFGAPDISSRPSETSLYRTSLAHPRPSRAKAYLRHMASSTSIQGPQRPNSTPVHRSTHSMRNQSRVEKPLDDPSIIFGRRGNGEGEEDHHGKPALPATWLETVARAVLLSGSGVVGGPKPRQPTLRPARSSLSQGSKLPARRRAPLSEHTNLPPPPLLTMLERGRAGRSESEVSRTKVVCRSAPGSRASSSVRGHHERSRGRENNRKRGTDHERMPSLARTQTEGDAWHSGVARLEGLTANEVKNLYLSGVGISRASHFDHEDETHGEEEFGTLESSEDEGELDLARILVHPKRQQSIRSLRKHLHHQLPQRPLSAGSRRPMRGPSTSSNYIKSPLSEDDDWAHEFGHGWTRRAGCGEDEDDAASLAVAFGDFNRNASSSKRARPNLPGWGTRS